MSAVHELVLQPELFELVESVDRPTAKAGFMADELFSSFINNHVVTEDEIIVASNKIDYYKGKMNANRMDDLCIKCENYYAQRIIYEAREHSKTPIYLDPKSRKRVINCIKALEKNKKVQKLLHPEGLVETPISKNEYAVLLDVQVKTPWIEPFVLKLKAKLDNLTIDKESNLVTVNDIKTIGKTVNYFNDNFEKFHYHRELAIYSWLATLVAEKHYNMKNCIVASNCLVVSTIPDFYTKVYALNKADFKKGWNEFKYLLRLAAYYYSKGYRFC